MSDSPPRDIPVPTDDQWQRRIYIGEPILSTWMPPSRINAQDLTITFVLVALSHVVRGAVELHYKTPEEISREEGFAFTPSVDYIMSKIGKPP